MLRAQARSGTRGRTNRMAWERCSYRKTLRACTGEGVLSRPETFELVQGVLRCAGCS